MQLKKWLCMFVALTTANAVFAGTMFTKNLIRPALPAKTIQALMVPTRSAGQYPEKSQLEYLINNAFLGYELLPLLQPITEEMEPIVATAMALRAGLLAYAAEVTAGRQLTGNNKSIDEILQTIPSIFNKIQNSSEEIADEILPVLEQLSNYVVANQNKVSKSEIDQEMASQLLMTFVYQKAELEGSLTMRVSRIFQQEVQELLESMQE